MSKPPSFQFYPGDRLQELLPILNDNEAVGAWLKAVMYLWSHGPSDAERLGLAVGSGWERVGFLFSGKDGLMMLEWMEEMRAERAAFVDRQRSNGRRGGRPKARNVAGKNPSLSSGITQKKPRKSPRVEDEDEDEGIVFHQGVVAENTISEISEKKKETNSQLESEINARGSTNEPSMGPSTTPTENVQHDQKEATSRPPKKQPDPLPFTSDRFAAAWTRWETSRRESRKPITPTARSMQLAKCAQWGEDRAIAALDHSAANGYQGLFEPTHKSEPPKKDINKGIIKHGDKIETTWM